MTGDRSRLRGLRIVLEGFFVLLGVHVLGGLFLGLGLTRLFPSVPVITIAIFSSSAISQVSAITYLAFRFKCFPRFILNKTAVLYALVGIILASFLIMVQVSFFGKEVPAIQEELNTPPPYRYLNLLAATIWGPFAEEVLFRGYFFEELRESYGALAAGLLSTGLFVILHAIGGLTFGLIFIFLYSALFTFAYMRGGLLGAIVSHIFSNVSLVCLNAW